MLPMVPDVLGFTTCTPGVAPPHQPRTAPASLPLCYEHFGLVPAKPGTRWGTSESQFTDPLLTPSGEQPGAMVFFTGEGGPPPGHVGISLGGGKYVGADGPEGAENRIEPSGGNMGFRVPKKGWIPGGVLGQLVTAMMKTEPFGKATAAKAGGVTKLVAAGGKPVADALVNAAGYGFATGGTVPDTLDEVALHQVRASTEKSVAAKVAAEAAALAAMGGGGSLGEAGTKGTMSPRAIGALWIKNGGPAGIAPIMAAIAMRESGDQPSIVQQGQPPGLTGYGLWQITPTSGIWQNGKFGNLLNADNNAKAAVYLYNAAGGISPWYSSGGMPAPAYAMGGAVRGYAGGGVIPEPVAGYGLRSGRSYSFRGAWPRNRDPRRSDSRCGHGKRWGDHHQLPVVWPTDAQPGAAAGTVPESLSDARRVLISLAPGGFPGSRKPPPTPQKDLRGSVPSGMPFPAAGCLRGTPCCHGAKPNSTGAAGAGRSRHIAVRLLSCPSLPCWTGRTFWSKDAGPARAGARHAGIR